MRPALILKRAARIGRFGLVGGLSVATYYALLYGLTEFVGVWYVASAFVAFGGYFAINFLSQKYWTFKNRDQEAVKRQLAEFSVMACCNWVINTSLLYVLVEYVQMYYLYAQGILTLLVSILAYFGLKYIFRS